jgi:polysaccharide export outer membrane protein
MDMNSYRIALMLLLLPFGLLLAQDPTAGDDSAAAAVENYDIGIEDVLRVVVWNEPDLTVDVAVRPDGKITLPLIDDVDVKGHSPLEVRDMITERLSRFIREPSVTVIVAEINSFRVFILGEVNTPGMLTFRRPTRLLQALASAGGLTQYSKKEALLLRDQYGVEKRVQINLKHLLAGDTKTENLLLRPNDTLIIF